MHRPDPVRRRHAEAACRPCECDGQLPSLEATEPREAREIPLPRRVSEKARHGHNRRREHRIIEGPYFVVSGNDLLWQCASLHGHRLCEGCHVQFCRP